MSLRVPQRLIPNLDDRNYDQLVSEAVALIPKYFPAWSDHNPSDPGIALLELFAFFSEAAIYQLNRIPDRTLQNFAHLVGVERSASESIPELLGNVVRKLGHAERAVTQGEIEALALQVTFGAGEKSESVARMRLVPGSENAGQWLRLVIVPAVSEDAPLPSAELRQAVFESLRRSCLITTRILVVAPVYSDLDIAVTIVRDPDSLLGKAQVQQSVTEAVRGFLHPLTGSAQGTGWEFGRSVFRSELYEQMEGLPGVDHVQRLELDGGPSSNEWQLAHEGPADRAIALVRLRRIDVTVEEG